ncbi:helix-turn-helix transcriptional regulator [Lachnospiraceae bacterium MD1]|uniref:Helix-turn-helix transcriptional regulator n=1 Tax=Variimorphobacter saccharofermentans TaxID=2755051 RepID=A0A839JYC2_9FIRM|nr:helix-turn-helix transcriptional regulator [Variimorphobacter saccharofermentans]MBB2182228.1 helix-turn-helix transcriptional regulator [Variimorphobacter saccharofermentans]
MSKIKGQLSVEIGERIRLIRESYSTSKKLSLEKFAEILNCDPKKLSRIETGCQMIDTELLIKLSQETGKSLEFILTGQDDFYSARNKEFKMKIKQILEVAYELLKKLP